jgi:hypothetical protein
MKSTIITSVSLDDNRSVADQLVESSNAADYIIDDIDDLQFLHSIAGLLWADLNIYQKKRVIQWLVSDMVYPGVVNFDYTMVCPQDKCCPACHKPMTVFDEDIDLGKRFICYDCGLITSITPATDVPGCEKDGEDDE